MKKIGELFIIERGKGYSKYFEENPKSDISYITTSGALQGVNAKVNPNKNHKLYEKGTITVALQGTILSSFVQINNCYLQAHVAALTPKEKLSLKEKIYYCLYINQYKYMYSYGRSAGPTLQNLLVPEKYEIPSWVYEVEIPDYSSIVEPKENKVVELPDSSKWREFLFPEVFNMERGKGTSARDAKENPGRYPYIGASAKNNGITIFTNNTPTHKANSITVATDGSVGQTFYQKKDFSSTSNIVVLKLKNRDLNPFIGLFLTTLIKQVGEAFDYGRKWGITRMKESKISLPVDLNGDPDWQLMEDYIKSLPYSLYI